MALKFFISHTRGDAGLARKIARAIEKHGGQAFLDATSLRPGQIFVRQLRDALRRSDIVIAVVSKSSARNPGLNSELGAALALGKRVAVVVQGVEPDELPPPLKSFQAMAPRDIDRYLDQISRETTIEAAAI